MDAMLRLLVVGSQTSVRGDEARFCEGKRSGWGGYEPFDSVEQRGVSGEF